MPRAVSLLAAAAFAATPASAPLKLTPRHTATTRVYARSRGELWLRAAAHRCAQTLSIAVDRHRRVTVRASRAKAEYPVARVARGWHRVVLRASGSRCRSAVVIDLVPPPARPAPQPPPTRAPATPPSPTPPASAGPPTLPPAPASAPAQITGTTNPFSGRRFYIDPSSSAAQSESSYLAQGDTTDANLMAKITDNPHAEWFGGWNGADPSAAVSGAVAQAASVGALPVLVTYNIPDLDCSGQGAATPADYQTWIDGFTRGIGDAQAVVVLEPDALPEIDCMTAAQQQTTLSLLSYAVQKLSANPGTSVYIDAGNSGWQPADVIATRLKTADVAQATGFSLNVSNFLPTATEESYGDSVSALIGGRHFIVDTSRNGQGSDGQWCNPPGRGLGQPATTNTGDPLADALFWIKPPGESDGTCNGGPAGGTWWPAYALGLAQNASF